MPAAFALVPGRPEAQLARLLLGAAFGSLAFLYVLARWRTLPPGFLGRALAIALASRLLLLALPPLLSEDLWRYLWDGALQHLGYGPYDHAPISPALDAAVARMPELGDVRDRIGHAALPTVYPPPAELLFRAATTFGPSALFWRAITVLAELGAALALRSWLSRTGRNPRAVVLWLFCPLPALESAVGGHVDAWGLLGLAAAGSLLAHGPSGRTPLGVGRSIWAGLALALAAGTKLFPLVALPRVGLRVALACVSALAATSLLLPGAFTRSSLSTFGQRWQANDGLFALLHAGFSRIWTAPETGSVQPGLVHAVGRALVGPSAAGVDAPLMPDELGLAAAKVVAGTLLLLVLAHRLWRARDLEGVLGPFTAALLLLSPVVHPWYLLWWLPFAVLAEARGGRARAWLSRPFWVWSTLIWLAYLPRLSLVADGRWVVPHFVAPLEYVPVWIALASAAWGAIHRRPGPVAGAPR